MPIVSNAQDKKEKEALESIRLDAEKADAKRRRNAKRTVSIFSVGMSFSLVVYFMINPLSGIFSAIFFSSLPSVVNLIDD